MNFFLVGLVFGAFLTLGCEKFYEFTDSDSGKPDSVASGLPVAISSNKENGQKISEESITKLLTENAALKNEFKKLQKIQAADSVQPVLSSTPSPANNALPDNIRSALAKIELANVEKYISDNAGSNFAEVALKNFEKEKIDESWSGEYQKNIENYFHTTKEIFELVPSSIECRSSRCRVSVAVASESQIQKYIDLMSISISENKNGMPKKLMYMANESKGTLDFYVARNDDSNLLQ